MADDADKLAGQRKAVREHIGKYEEYPDAYDKAFALKTVRRVQNEISALRAKHKHWAYSWEDDWNPPKN
jgi:NADPH-dependent 7-cyano-7-deazaguanine reductase QueF-like protein